MSDLWREICDGVRSRGRLTDHLPLQCPKHAEAMVEARTASDFLKCPHGGCKVMCGDHLECGHQCTLLCHQFSHDMIDCRQPCLKPRPVNCTHGCAKLCFQECGPCLVRVKKLRKKCGHTNSVPCHADAESGKCSSICGKNMLCGHSCNEPCSGTGHDDLRHICMRSCNRTPLCGHPCLKKCHEQCGMNSS